MNPIDIVVVAYNSREHLRGCVEPLAALESVRVIVVDNASSDATLDTILDLPVTTVALESNGGFAHGCNEGWRRGDAPHVLFINPDARIDERSLRRLSAVLEHDEHVAAAAPRIEHPDGSLAFSQRRFPRLRSTYARALFLHRLFPRAAWTDQLVRDARDYERGMSPEWVSGACVLVMRSALVEIGGWSESYFMYCEDLDLCWRLRRRGYDVRFEPAAVAVHVEGQSAPQSTLLPVLAASRVRYARTAHSRGYALVERAGLGLEAVLRIGLTRKGRAHRAGHARSLREIVR